MRVAFDPPPGLVSNDTVYAVPGAWADASNIRFYQGRPQTIGGWEAAFAETLTGVCRNVHNWTNNAAVQNVAFGTHNALHIWLGGAFGTITPVPLPAGSTDASGGGPGYGTGTYGSGTYGTPQASYIVRTWSLDTWGENLLAVPRAGSLYRWENSLGTPAAMVSQAPSVITAMLVTPERQVLALGCNEETSNDFNALCIRGCDIEDLTDWTTSSSNNAFEHILEGGGQIVTGRMVGPFACVWTDNALHQGQFIGSGEQTYRFDRIDKNCGVIGANAVCVHNGIAYWIGNDRQFRAWSPGGKPTILPCPIWKEFADNLHASQASKIVAASNSRFDEIWFHYPDARDGSECSRYVAFSITPEGLKWFKGAVARTAACDAGVLAYPMAVTVDGHVHYHELGTDADGEALEWSIRSAAFYLDEAERVLQVQRINPDFKGQENDVSLTAFVRDRPQGGTTIRGPHAIAAGAGKVDFRISGAIVELEFTGAGYVRFGRPTFDAIAIGKR